MASVSGAADPLCLTEWLAGALELRPDMRVLDLGCGRAASSIFVHREFGLQVWATGLWFSESENLQRIRDAGAENGVLLCMPTRNLCRLEMSSSMSSSQSRQAAAATTVSSGSLLTL